MMLYYQQSTAKHDGEDSDIEIAALACIAQNRKSSAARRKWLMTARHRIKHRILKIMYNSIHRKNNLHS